MNLAILVSIFYNLLVYMCVWSSIQVVVEQVHYYMACVYVTYTAMLIPPHEPQYSVGFETDEGCARVLNFKLVEM